MSSSVDDSLPEGDADDVILEMVFADKRDEKDFKFERYIDYLQLECDKDVHSQEAIMKCCMELIHHSQWRSQRLFCSGSSVEIPNSKLVITNFIKVNGKLDIDQMAYKSYQYAFSRTRDIFKNYTGEVIRIYTANDQACTADSLDDNDNVHADNSDIHAGFARLIMEKENTEILLKNLLPKLTCVENINGPAVTSNRQEYYKNNEFSLSKASADILQFEKMSNPYSDIVYVIHSPHWPEQASEWPTRLRIHGFPTKSVIKQVVSYGCDFVQKSHSRLSYNNDWRFSFSKAEIIIAKSWTKAQRSVYLALWLINKQAASGSRLCSYYYKTLMFWTCEKRPVEFWTEDVLVDSVRELLLEMINWAISRTCLNYFIPSNNMMDHFSGTDLSGDVEYLRKMYQLADLISEIIDICEAWEIILGNRTRHIVLPSWVKRSLVIYHRVENLSDSYIDLFNTDLTPDFRNALYVELYDVFMGLWLQQKAANFASFSNQSKYIKQSEHHLTLATILSESNERDRLYNCSTEIIQLMLDFFMVCEPEASTTSSTDNVVIEISRASITDDRQQIEGQNTGRHEVLSDPNRLNGPAKQQTERQNTVRQDALRDPGRQQTETQKCDIQNKPSGPSDLISGQGVLSSGSELHLQYYCCQLVEQLENKSIINILSNVQTIKDKKINLAMHTLTKLGRHTVEDVKFRKEWPGQSPTVNISWFIAKAYLANLYYTTHRNFSMAIQACDDIINVYMQSDLNQRFAERTFPVILSTQWTKIYDSEIQRLLGFYSLSSYVLDKYSSRSVYLGVCPVHFAIYVKIRTAGSPRDLITQTRAKEYTQHITVCECDNKVGYGQIILDRAIMIWTGDASYFQKINSFGKKNDIEQFMKPLGLK